MLQFSAAFRGCKNWTSIFNVFSSNIVDAPTEKKFLNSISVYFLYWWVNRDVHKSSLFTRVKVLSKPQMSEMNNPSSDLCSSA